MTRRADRDATREWRHCRPRELAGRSVEIALNDGGRRQPDLCVASSQTQAHFSYADEPAGRSVEIAPETAAKPTAAVAFALRGVAKATSSKHRRTVARSAPEGAPQARQARPPHPRADHPGRAHPHEWSERKVSTPTTNMSASTSIISVVTRPHSNTYVVSRSQNYIWVVRQHPEIAYGAHCSKSDRAASGSGPGTSSGKSNAKTARAARRCAVSSERPPSRAS